MKRLPNIHPGEVLKEEFLDPLGISAYRRAKETFMPQTRIRQIIHKNEVLPLIRHYGYPNTLEPVPNFGLVCRTITILKKKLKTREMSWMRLKR